MRFGVIAQRRGGEPPAPEVDPHFASVVSLLNFQGNITDAKGKTWTANGDAAVSGGALVLDGTGDYLSTPSDADFAFGTGDFCIELWHEWSAASKIISFFDFRGGTANSARPMVYNANSSPFTDHRYFVSNADRITAPSGTLVTGTPQHISIARVSGTSRMFADGVQVGSDYTDGTDYTQNGVLLGRNSATTGRDYNGKIWAWRVTKGVGRYSGTFTPPSHPFPTA